MSPRIGGLCFGYGGLDLAVQAVIPDAELAWYAEYDKGASKIGAHRFPGVPNHGDMTRIDWSAVEPVDILTGGTPCQDLSHAGKRAGMTEGTRSNLWVAMREAIATIKPGFVVWENVGGAASAAADSEVEPCPGCVGDRPGVHLRALGRVVGDLSSLGYVGRVRAVRAADVGAPHGRLRYFLGAWPAADAQGRGRREGRPEPARFLGRPDAPVGRLLPTPAAYDGERGGAQDPAKRAAGGHSITLQDAAHGLMLPTPQARDWKGYGPADGNRHDPNLSAVPLLLPTPVVTDSSGTRNRTAGRSEDAKPFAVGTTLGDVVYDRSWGEYADAIHRWEALTRPAPDPTELGPKGSPRLSARFSEWMMGLPDGWVTDVPGITRNEALKALGNGVVPQQAAAAIGACLSGAEVAA